MHYVKKLKEKGINVNDFTREVMARFGIDEKMAVRVQNGMSVSYSECVKRELSKELILHLLIISLLAITIK